MLTEEQLAEWERVAKEAESHTKWDVWVLHVMVTTAVPALIAEVRRLREENASLVAKLAEIKRMRSFSPLDARSSGASKHPL